MRTLVVNRYIPIFLSKYCDSLVKLTRKFNSVTSEQRIQWRRKYFNAQRKSYCVCADNEEQCKPESCNVGRKNFDDEVYERRNEAKRSILVQVSTEKSCNELYHYCNNIVPVKKIFHYTINQNHFVLIEFVGNCVEAVLETCVHLNNNSLKSSMLWFKTKDNGRRQIIPNCNVPIEMETKPIDNNEFQKFLTNADSISEQMKILFDYTKLDELGYRLRYLTARQIEMALEVLFHRCNVLPFGSSVNGFGRLGCDLDLVLNYENYDTVKDSRLVFQTKGPENDNRIKKQKHMEILSEIIHFYLPGCVRVIKILQARVPILKYSHDYTGIDCDVSMTNTTGFHMSALLHFYTCYDDRVQPLVFTIKRWAKAVGLTSDSPGRWITNFSLTALVLFYLQTKKILPSLNSMISLARPEDVRFAEQINCTFLRDSSFVTPKGKLSKDTLEELLTGFFEFYNKFDFQGKSISIPLGHTTPKPSYSPLYIVNPLERGLNVSKNVSPEEVERLRIELRNAAWNLEQSTPHSNLTWGIMELFKPSEISKKAQDLFHNTQKSNNIRRIFDVHELFYRNNSKKKE